MYRANGLRTVKRQRKDDWTAVLNWKPPEWGPSPIHELRIRIQARQMGVSVATARGIIDGHVDIPTRSPWAQVKSKIERDRWKKHFARLLDRPERKPASCATKPRLSDTCPATQNPSWYSDLNEPIPARLSQLLADRITVTRSIL